MHAPPIPASLQSSLNATKVEHVQPGASRIRVSVPILGTMGIGSNEWQPWAMEEDEGLELSKAAWDRGARARAIQDMQLTADEAKYLEEPRIAESTLGHF